MLSEPRSKSLALRPCPTGGDGVHRWLFAGACACARAGLSENDAVFELERRMTRQPSPASEIVSAVAAAYREAGNANEGWLGTWARRAPAWPGRNDEQREAVSQRFGGLAELAAASPVRFDDGASQAEDIVDALFPGNPLLCCGRSVRFFDTRPREQWRGQLAKLQLIVPNPMTARRGLTKDGRTSAHALSITSRRRFLVVEQDNGTLDLQASILLHLATSAPLVLACLSGGKSVHGWFYVAGRHDEEIRPWFLRAVVLGADAKLWLRSQFCRLPDGTRDNGRRQSVVFFNPNQLLAATSSQP